MNIMFCLGSMTKGGAERVVANLSNYLVEKENEITIITTIIGKSVYPLKPNVNHIFLDKNNENKNFILKNINRIIMLKKYIKNIKPDIIISLLPEPSFRVLLLKKKLKIPVIISVRNDPKVEYSSKINKYLMNKLYPKADGFIFQTQQASQYFNTMIRAKSVIIPNPISDEFLEDELIKNNKEKIIINIGRLEEQKNQKILIEAFREIYEKYPEYKLEIYGEGSLKNELQKQIDEYKLQKSIKLCGEVDNIKQKMIKSDIFVLCSNYEGMPNTLMEAMAIGLPCISTDCPCGGPNFLIQNENNGILIKTNDKQALIDKITLLIENKELKNKISQNAKKIRNTLNSKEIYKKWEDYIKKIEETY